MQHANDERSTTQNPDSIVVVEDLFLTPDEFRKHWVYELMQMNNPFTTVASKLIAHLWKGLNKETNEISIVLHDKQKMVEELGMKMNHLNQALFKLTKHGTLVRLGQGKYKLSDSLFKELLKVSRATNEVVKQTRYNIV
jgi:hypothetical protein